MNCSYAWWNEHDWRDTHIDYRCEDGRFQVSTSCETISIPKSLSSNETGVNAGIRSWKKHSSEWAWCQRAMGGIYSTKKWRADTPQRGLEFGNFKPRLKTRYHQLHLLAERFVFRGWWSGYSERGSQNLSNGTDVASWLVNFVFCLHIYSLCTHIASRWHILPSTVF